VAVKAAFHDADIDTDTADILARMSVLWNAALSGSIRRPYCWRYELAVEFLFRTL